MALDHRFVGEGCLMAESPGLTSSQDHPQHQQQDAAPQQVGLNPGAPCGSLSSSELTPLRPSTQAPPTLRLPQPRPLHLRPQGPGVTRAQDPRPNLDPRQVKALESGQIRSDDPRPRRCSKRRRRKPPHAGLEAHPNTLLEPIWAVLGGRDPPAEAQEQPPQPQEGAWDGPLPEVGWKTWDLLDVTETQ